METKNKMRQLANELHKPARKNFDRRKVLLKGMNDLMQIDLIEMIKVARFNKGYKYILTAIDCFTKLAYGVPLKTKTGAEVSVALETILRVHPIKNIQSDYGKEFYNSTVQTLFKKYNVNHYSTFTNLKASIVERFNRTIKAMLYKEFTLNNNQEWLTILQSLITKYNDTIHSTTGMKPNAIGIKHEKLLLNKINSNTKQIKNPKFKVNDVVRISVYKNVFAKSYLINWTEQLYRVRKVQPTYPTTYLLSNYNTHENIKGAFYEQELQKTNLTDFFRIDKVVKTNKVDPITKEQLYRVKYKNSELLSYLPLKDLVKI